MKALDWLARLVLLIVSALATLALVGSLASVSNTPLGQAFPGGGTDTQAEAREQFVEREPVELAPRGDEPRAADPQGALPRAVAVQREGADVGRWLKALTYAVLALAGFAAAALVVLVRIAAHLGRLAGR